MSVRGLWCGPTDFGLTPASVEDMVAKLADHGFNLLLPEVKGGHGLLRWPSESRPEAVEPPFREFDLCYHLVEQCSKRGVELHAWFIDFFEGENGPAFSQHPEWAARNAYGNPTNHEQLRGERFTGLWMCPAQSPGYSDQWLAPLYGEFVSRYGVDAVHHDYVRYPGDLAPDQYCFCDSCLTELPRWAGYINECAQDNPFDHELYDREYLEAHWEQSPRVLPSYWDRLPRHEKSRFLLDGSFFRYGRADLDVFFYQFRCEAVQRFVESVHHMVKSVRNDVGVSAAVFKNPIHSGRFIGQDWRKFPPYVDTIIPMDYRDHFPGSFEDYLDLLAESIARQKEWAQGAERYLTGFALWPLVRGDEPDELRRDRMLSTIRLIESKNPQGWVLFCAGDLLRWNLYDALK